MPTAATDPRLAHTLPGDDFSAAISSIKIASAISFFSRRPLSRAFDNGAADRHTARLCGKHRVCPC